MIIQRMAQAIKRQDWFQVTIEILIVVIGLFLGLRSRIHFLAFFVVALFAACGEEPAKAQGEPSVGFKMLETKDYSRAVTGGTSGLGVHPRPIRTYLWYPARYNEEQQFIRFGRYAELADEDIWPVEIAGILREKLKYSRRALARSLGPERYNALLQQPVAAIEEATALPGPFPLIVIGQGVYYESPVVFAALGEYLAGRGFVVATSPLVGTNSPIVTVDVTGLETQVRDLEYVIAQARGFSFVSQSKLGMFGFDMGGMAALILTMRNADVDALVTASSGVLYPHPSGIPVASPDYDPLALRVPWLHSVPLSWIREGETPENKSLFDTALFSERYLLLTESMGHVDYTSYALIKDRSATIAYWEAARPGDVGRYEAVMEYVGNFFTAFLKDDPGGLAFLSRDPAEVFPNTAIMRHRTAATPSITYEAFVQAVIANQAEAAIEEIRALQESDPNHILLNEMYLNRLVFSLRGTWRLNEEILPVLEFIAELYPTSANALRMLAEGYIELGDLPAAIKIYENLLEMDPEDKRNYIKPRLEWLNSQ